METAMTNEYLKGVSFDDIKAILRDLAERQKETDRHIKEYAEEQKETDRQMKEYAKQQAERQKELDRQIGNLTNTFGEIAEHLVAPGIVEKFNDLGYHFESVAPNGLMLNDEKGKNITQIDIYLENGNCVMAVEVKSKPKKQDIEHHIKRLEILRQKRNKINDTRKIYGAMAGAVFGKEEKDACVEAGFYVIEQTGDTMMIDVPEGFVPKGW